MSCAAFLVAALAVANVEPATLAAAAHVEPVALAAADIESSSPVLLGDEELEEQRAGFVYGGAEIQFGVEVRSYLDNELVLQTNFNTARGTLEISGKLAGAPSSRLQFGFENPTVVALANEGKTVFLQRTTGSIQNVILNTASNVDLRQEVDATLDIGSFAPFRNDIFAQRIGSAIAAMSALGLAAGRSN